MADELDLDDILEYALDRDNDQSVPVLRSDIVDLVARVRQLEAEKAAILGQIDQGCRLLQLGGNEVAAQIVIAQTMRWPEFVSEVAE